MKKLKAVAPYIYPNQLNFKDKPFHAWQAVGGEVSYTWYPRCLHKLMFNCQLPTLTSQQARLCFVQPVTINFDTFFPATWHEIVPLVWDCWPCYYDKMEKWLHKHKVKTALFTSKQEMDEMQNRCPEVKMIWCPEAVNCSLYTEGKLLKDRSIDVLEFGRSNDNIPGLSIPKLLESGRILNHVSTKVGDRFLFTDEELYNTMGNAKITVCVPRNMTQPELAGNIETLTQRYWEAMLSRMVIVGHAPQELVEICGYNPVIEIEDVIKQGGIQAILAHIDDYQDLVDRNRKVALEKGDWKKRMTTLIEQLQQIGYISK